MLAIEHLLLFVGTLAGMALLVWKAQLYVALAQRSNVETLTLAFFFVFFGYLAVLSAPGALGALRLLVFTLQDRQGGAFEATEQRKMRALGRPGSEAVAELNRVLEVEGQACTDLDFPVADRAGSMGVVRVQGARLRHLPAHGNGSSELLAYFQVQAAQLLEVRGQERLEIVVWKRTDDEAADQYHGLVEFARNLERQLEKGDLWPKARLIPADRQELERRLSAVCPALRNEGFLPQWDYQAEHKVAIIPEPLGLLSLSRTEQRVDPVSSMGCAVWVVLASLAIFALFVLFPPWVPGT
jgi:hypothetical protein